MARDQAANDITNTFKPTDMPLYSEVVLSGSGRGTRVKAIWVAVDAGGEKNYPFLEKEMIASGLMNTINFTATLPREWPTGAYRTDIYLNEKLAHSLVWEVKAP